MDRYPVDSAEAAEFRELDAAQADTATDNHDPRCREGWLGEDTHGHPTRCLTCRAHLIHRGAWSPH